MQNPSARNRTENAGSGAERFDAESVRRILQRAVEEQHGIDNMIADTYTVEELEEMAAEAGISSVALHAALDAERREDRPVAAPARDPGWGWLAALERRMPAHWTPGAKGAVMAGLGFVALAAVLLVLWAAAPTAFWVTALSLILVSLLVLIVGSPF
jgi:VIT1/CCC1 family predicted Fe2+/Mn2+ transporter